MPFPLEVKRAPSALDQAGRESLQREYTRLLRLAGAQIPDFARFDLALKELKRQDCEREDECLAQLAKKAESLYGLYASLDYTLEGAVWVSGRVVRDDGKVVRPTQVVKVKEGEFQADALKAITQLFDELKIGELPAERPVEPKVAEVPVIVPAVPEGAVVQIVDPGEGQRSAGRGVFIAGVTVAAVGAGLLATSQVIGAGLDPDSNGNLPAEQRSSFDTARVLSTSGIIGVAAGGAVAVAGALIWGLAPSAPAMRLSAAAGPSGATVFVQGEF